MTRVAVRVTVPGMQTHTDTPLADALREYIEELAYSNAYLEALLTRVADLERERQQVSVPRAACEVHDDNPWFV